MLFRMLQEIGKEMHRIQCSKDLWCNSLLKEINELKPDHAGKVGEEFIRKICLEVGIPNIYTGDVNSKDGTYDQKIGESQKKVEIKTARLGGGKYQHETLKISGYDYICFVDIHPKGGYVTILPPFTMTEKHPITETTPTLRKGTTDVFKWDFTDLHLKKLKDKGMTVEFDENTPYSVLGDFIKSKVV